MHLRASLLVEVRDAVGRRIGLCRRARRPRLLGVLARLAHPPLMEQKASLVECVESVTFIESERGVRGGRGRRVHIARFWSREIVVVAAAPYHRPRRCQLVLMKASLVCRRRRRSLQLMSCGGRGRRQRRRRALSLLGEALCFVQHTH